jgi:hypothetical protein
MQPLAQNGYTEEQVLRALRGEVGTRQFDFVYELLDEDNTVIRTLGNVLTGQITHDALADIKRTGRFTMTEDNTNTEPINFLKHRVKPYVRLQMPPLAEAGDLNPGGTYGDMVGLVHSKLARWPMDETTGTLVADVVGGHDITVGGPLTVNTLSLLGADDGGRALTFADEGALATCPDAKSFMNTRTSLSMALWLRPDSVGEDRYVVTTTASDTWGEYLTQTWNDVSTMTWDAFEGTAQVSTWDQLEASGKTWGELGTWNEPVRAVGGMSITTDAATKSYKVTLTVGTTQVTAFTPVNTQQADVTQFLVLTWNSGGPLKLYLDGVLVTETPSSVVGGLQGIGALTIGGTAHGFTGVVDDVLVVGDVLSPTMIRALFAVGAAVGPGAPPSQRYVQWSMGVFLMSSPTRAVNATGTVMRDIQAFDQTVVLESQSVSQNYYVASGAVYTAAVAELLGNTVGMGAYRITPSTLTVPVQRMWDAGTSNLRIVNDLLAAINYEPVWFDADGVAIIQPYVPPDSKQPEYEYTSGAVSVLLPEATEEMDLFKAPNQWVLLVSQPDRPLLKSVYTNTSASSPTSTVNRGRIITEFHNEQDAATQLVLDAKVQEYAQEAGRRFEQIRFTTAMMPMHVHRDSYRVSYPDLGVEGVYSEIQWSFDLSAGAQMSHTARRAAVTA